MLEGGSKTKVSTGWLAKSEKEWESEHNFAQLVAQLCRQYENVYCEMAYITELFDGDGLERFLVNIERARGGTGEFDFMSKLAFGSDWFMPSMAPRLRRYVDIFIRIFSRPEYACYREDFFWKNAYRYLRLEQ